MQVQEVILIIVSNIITVGVMSSILLERIKFIERSLHLINTRQVKLKASIKELTERYPL